MRRFGFLILAVLAFGCGPNPKAPVRLMALVPNETGALSTAQVELKTIVDLTSLRGSVVQFVGGTRVLVDENDPIQNGNGGLPAMNEKQRYEVLVKDRGFSPRGHFIDNGGVLWPADFHTWNMVSAFYNFERSYDYFVGVFNGKEPSELLGAKVLYWSDVHLNSVEPLTDNALFLSLLQSYIIVPFKTEQLVPLSMNLGVIAHEMAHRVFNHKVLADAGIHPALVGWNGPAFNLLKSLDEGLADFHGYGATCIEAAGCRPNFLNISMEDARIVEMRNVARVNACLDEPTRNALNQYAPGQWIRAEEMYRVGNLFAAALYFAGNKTGKVSVVHKALIEAYDDANPDNLGLRQLISGNLNTPNEFTLERVANSIAGHLPKDTEVQRQFCTEVNTRLQLRCDIFPCELMPACPQTATRDNNTCKRLPPPP
jgi:hypothetical protein